MLCLFWELENPSGEQGQTDAKPESPGEIEMT
jgi:hypothetical protein